MQLPKQGFCVLRPFSKLPQDRDTRLTLYRGNISEQTPRKPDLKGGLKEWPDLASICPTQRKSQGSGER